MPELDLRLYAPIATSIGIIVSIILWNLNQRRKEMSYRVMFLQPLLELQGETRRKCDIRFEGQPVPDACVAVVRIYNSGHLPILPGDYQVKVTVSPGPGARILSAEVVDTDPAGLQDTSLYDKPIIETMEQSRVILRPVLLNANNSITLQLLLSHPSERIAVDGHIQGVNDITENRESNMLSPVMVQIGAFVMAGAMLLAEPAALFSLSFEDMIPFLFSFLIGYILVFAGLQFSKKKDNKFSWMQ